VVTSFSLSAIDAVSASEPGLATALLVHPAGNPLRALLTARQHGHGGLHPFFLSVDADLMSAARASGTAIRAWTVDDPVQIAALGELGVDAVVTNDVRWPVGRSGGPTCRAPHRRSTLGDRPGPSGWPRRTSRRESLHERRSLCETNPDTADPPALDPRITLSSARGS